MLIQINPVNCGIYSITHKASGQAYVGSSVDIRFRVCTHLKKLSVGKHENLKMQSLYDVSEGNTAFECRIIEACTEEALDDREQFHIENGSSELNIHKNKFGRQARMTKGRQMNDKPNEPKPTRQRKTRCDKKERTPEQKREADRIRQAKSRARKKVGLPPVTPGRPKKT